jgi:hypothetical protein
VVRGSQSTQDKTQRTRDDLFISLLDKSAGAALGIAGGRIAVRQCVPTFEPSTSRPSGLSPRRAVIVGRRKRQSHHPTLLKTRRTGRLFASTYTITTMKFLLLSSLLASAVAFAPNSISFVRREGKQSQGVRDREVTVVHDGKANGRFRKRVMEP